MTGKERVRVAAAHREPDRVPLDYWATPEITAGLIARFGLTGVEELLQLLSSDVRYVFPEYRGPARQNEADGTSRDIWSIRRDPVYNEVVAPPLADTSDVSALDSFPWPDPAWYDYAGIAAQCERHRDSYVVVSAERTNRPTILHQGIYLCGLEKIMTDFYLQPDFVHALFDRVADFYAAVLENVFQAGCGKIDAVLIGDDFGTQESLLVSSAMLRSFVFPRLRRYFEIAHAHGVKVLLHSCGAIRPIIPDLIDLGVDILNPIQVRARDMIPAELKSQFGSRLCFHGSMDIQRTLPFGSAEEVRREVAERLAVLGPGGGFILAPTHNFQKATPLENIVVMYETARAKGRYPL